MKLAFLICVFLLVGCREISEVMVKINMGGSTKSLIETSPIALSSDCIEELGLCLHEFDFPFSASGLPSIDLLAGQSSVVFKNVVGVSIFENKKEPASQLEYVRMTLRGVPSRSEIEVAKRFAYTTVKNVLNAGWKRYIYPFDPRIAGVETVKLEACSGKVLGQFVLSHPCFDPTYEMTDAQWLETPGSYNWYFYKDGYYLLFSAWRSRGLEDPAGQASYLFTVEIKSEKEFWSEAFEGKEKLRWRELLPGLLEKYRVQRETLEVNAEGAGLIIDRSYEDTPISAIGR